MRINASMRIQNNKKFILKMILFIIIVIGITISFSYRMNDEADINLVKQQDENLYIKVGDVGNIITFGKYYSDVNSMLGSLKWVVIDKNDELGMATLITKDIVDFNVFYDDVFFNERKEVMNWEKSTIRKWLNEEFYNVAFSKNEQKVIAETKLQFDFVDETNSNFTYGQKKTGETTDRVFLLSREEVEKFKDSDWVKYVNTTLYAIDNYRQKRQTLRDLSEYKFPWLLRSSIDGDDADAVTYGYDFHFDLAHFSEYNGIRPCISVYYRNGGNEYIIEEIQDEVIKNEFIAKKLIEQTLESKSFFKNNKIQKEVSKEELNNQVSSVESLLALGENTKKEEIQTVLFGCYEQDNNHNNGKEPIEWFVLEKQNDRALLYTKNAIDAMAFNDRYEDVRWETCTLRKWLNNDFYNNAFTDKEKDLIITTEVDNNHNILTGDSGNNTNDKVYLLNFAEIEKYFGHFKLEHKNDVNEILKCNSTEFAKIKNGADIPSVILRDIRKYKDEIDVAWVRGKINAGFTAVNNVKGFGNRMAIWVSCDLNEDEIDTKIDNIDYSEIVTQLKTNKVEKETNYEDWSIDYFYNYLIEEYTNIDDEIKNFVLVDSPLNENKGIEFLNNLKKNKEVVRIDLFNNYLVVAYMDSDDCKNDRIVIYDNKFNIVKEINGYCIFSVDKINNNIIVKHRIDNRDIYQESNFIEDVFSSDNLIGYNIIDENLNLEFEVPLLRMLCKSDNEKDENIDTTITDIISANISTTNNINEYKNDDMYNDGFRDDYMKKPISVLNVVLCEDFYKKYLYDLKNKKEVEFISGIDINKCELKDIYARVISKKDTKDGELKIVVANEIKYLIDESYNIIMNFHEKNVRFVNKNCNLKNEVVVETRDENEAIHYYSINGLIKEFANKEDIIFLENGYYFLKEDVYKNYEKDVARLILRKINNNTQNEITVDYMVLPNDYNKIRVNEILGKTYIYFEDYSSPKIYQHYYNIYDMNSQLKFRFVAYNPEVIIDSNSIFKNGLLIVKGFYENSSGNKYGRLYYLDKNFNEVHEPTNYSSSGIEKTSTYIRDNKAFLKVDSGMWESLLNIGSLEYCKYMNRTTFTNILVGSNDILLIDNKRGINVTMDFDFNILESIYTR